MNGMNLKKAILAVLSAMLICTTLQGVQIWPDKIEPPIALDEAIRVAKLKIVDLEQDPVFCLNATLLNGENGNTNHGYWLIAFATELGNNYSVAIRMDRKISLRKVKGFQINLNNPWPATITPPISIEAAYQKAVRLIGKESKKNYYCLNATLVTGSEDIVRDGMWNFVFQTKSEDPRMINIRMNGKTAIKEVNQITQID